MGKPKSKLIFTRKVSEAETGALLNQCLTLGEGFISEDNAKFEDYVE